jgi:hypothetical protein
MAFCEIEGQRIIGLVHPNSSVECLIPTGLDRDVNTKVRLSFDGESWSEEFAFRPVKGKRAGRIKSGKVATLQNGSKWTGMWHLVLIVVLTPVVWLSKEKRKETPREKEASPNAELLPKVPGKAKRGLPGTRKREPIQP